MYDHVKQEGAPGSALIGLRELISVKMRPEFRTIFDIGIRAAGRIARTQIGGCYAAGVVGGVGTRVRRQGTTRGAIDELLEGATRVDVTASQWLRCTMPFRKPCECKEEMYTHLIYMLWYYMSTEPAVVANVVRELGSV